MNRRESIAHLCAAVVAGTGWLRSRAWARATTGHCVLIEAGRRVDAPDSQTARFPPSNVPKVRERIRKLVLREKPAAVVCSAACGTDLLLLDLAGKKRIQQIAILASDPETFRKGSVTDRPGDWGELFDQVLKTAKVEVLKVPEGQEGYLQTNLMLLDRGEELARSLGVPARALVIWNQESRGPDDVTEHFLKQAKKRGIPVLEISTL